MKKVKKKLPSRIKNLFYFLVANFVFIIVELFTPFARNFMGGGGIYLLPFVTFSVGGFWMAYLVKKSMPKEDIGKYPYMTGLSAGFILVSVILHNLITAVVIYMTGNWDFEEPVFFVLAVIILPVLFILGAARTLLLTK